MRINPKLLVLISILLTSCMVGPDYVRPKVLVPAKFKEAQAQKSTKNWRPIKPQDISDRGSWWLVFHDPVLNDLELQLNQYNQSAVQAAANYRQSLALVEQARAGLFPTLAGSANVFRQKQGGGTSSSINTAGGSTSTSITTSNTVLSAVAPTNTVYSGVLSASWEPDIWGLVRRTIEANTAAAQASGALLAATRLSLQSSLAQYYFELRTLDINQRLLDDTVHSYQKIVRLTQHQYTAGVVSRSDIVQAQSQLEMAQAQAVNNGILRGQYEHAIAVLIGRPPAYLSLNRRTSALTVPDIPVSIPSVWLERRPDIAQAERTVQNTSALIGVAVATFYPNLTLTGAATATGLSLSRLIHTPVLSWSTGAQLAQTFFDGGLRRASVHSAQAAYESSVAAYRQVVLTAFQDVEDNLIALRLLKEEYRVQRQAAVHAQQASQLMLNQYKAGTVAFSNVITTQITAYTAQKAVNDVSGLQLSAAVGLIKALGGGWSS